MMAVDDPDVTGTASLGERTFTVEQTMRSGFREDEERLQFSVTRPERFGTLTDRGPETVEQDITRPIGSIPEKYGYELMHAIADYYNCKVVEK